ncbi:MAG: hypothetical protein L0Z62_32065, partial [Gemmataceae bacterium]|nr:hypothetical protein [Gemmataceae bacterium]
VALPCPREGEAPAEPARREPRPPGGTAEQLFHIESIPFDLWLGEAPYEERVVHDEALFASLPDRVGAVARDWPFRPLLPVLWDEVMSQARRTPLLGERFASARRTLERAWGCHNLELPVSVLCGTDSFAWFACHLLAELPRFHALYNETVRRYRRAHGIRSRNHPVPDLAAEGDWLEAPFWAWRVGESRRGRLLVRLTGSALELRAGTTTWPSLPRPAQGAEMIAAWRDMAADGFKVRSRALTNTLFARVFLADLFVHGIGGGKYDELTDALIRGFYGLEPPAFLILSATLRLPFEREAGGSEHCRGLQLQLRDLHWNPQRYLSSQDAAVTSLLAQKRSWQAQQPADRRERRERFEALRALTGKLRAFVAVREDELRQELAVCELLQRSAGVLGRRDYAFCLHPEERLRPFCTRFLAP